MIEKFSGQRYKAFDQFDLEFKSITILLGSNSTGKSAIVNSLLMLSQSANFNLVSESPLRLNGSKVGMGEALNIVSDKDPNKTISFAFSLSASNSPLDAVKHFRDSTLEGFQYLMHHMVRQLKEAPRKSPNLVTLLEEIERFNPRAAHDVRVQGDELGPLFIAALKYYRKLVSSKSIESIFGGEVSKFLDGFSLRKITDCFDSLLSIDANKLCPVKFSYAFGYDQKSNSLKLSEYSQWNADGGLVLRLEVGKDKYVKCASEVFDEDVLYRCRVELSKALDVNSLRLMKGNLAAYYDSWSFFYLRNSVNPFVNLFVALLGIGTRQLLNEISPEQINHVSPLRAFPQRYYLLDKTIHHRQLNSLDGTELAEILKNNPPIRKNINRLLARFNIAIDVEQVNDIIHKIIVTQDSVRLELTDVGFGISQSLPVLVQAYLSPKNSLTIIEQPEIHLHPNMQAWLADALIDIALAQDKKFLIETHSEALIRRVRLRILDSASALSDDDVKIYHLHRSEEKSRTLLEEIPINSNGDIKWPLDFMDAEINDTLEIQRLKSEKIIRSFSQAEVGHNG